MEKNLGHATAYGYAKSKGYSGTEDEFAELMADYASVGQSAAQSAEQAAASATSASGLAATATQAAQTATSKASEAVTAADTATTKASEASTSADTASAAATSASTSAQTATTAASTATTKASEAAVSANTATTAKTDAEKARDAAVQSASEAAASAESIDPETLEHKVYGAYVVESASGAIASFADGADSIPMKDVLVHIEPVQEGSGDPSLENVRPISGWTGAKVTRTGKNLADFVDGYGVNTDGHITAIANRTATIMPIRIKSGYRYRFNSNPAIACIYAVWKGDELIRRISGTPSGSILNIDGGDTLYVTAYAGSTNVTKDTHHPMITLEDDNYADYEPYSGQTYDITFPSEAGTVYGGTLDVTKGELVVDRAMVDLGTPTWVKHASLTNVFQAYRPNTSPAWSVVPNGGIADAVCDIYKLTTSATGGVGDIDMSIALGTGTSATMYVHDSRFIDVSDFISSVSGSKLVYQLATPITYHLTPQEITSLLGINNVWADTGSSEVEYRADTKLYVDNKIAELQALVLENNGGN